MNAKDEKSPDELLSLRIMDEISANNELTQRALSERLGIALGLVNTYIKHLVKKGYIRVSQFPKARYKYLITPEGLSEKSRLVYKHLSYYNNFFKTVRNDSLKLFKALETKGYNTISFCGIDEVAEIAYLSLKETKLNFLGFYDVSQGKCLGFTVLKLQDIKKNLPDIVFISCNKNKAVIFKQLISLNIESDRIKYLGDIDEYSNR